jgi:putative peptidoglycan lipid II flippase
VVTSVIYQTGRFGRADSLYVWAILAGAGIGLLATNSSRLYSSTFYALRDTRTPLRIALLRVALTTGLGYLAAFHLPGWLGVERRWGVAGLTAAAGLVAWIELALLRRALHRVIGSTGFAAKPLLALAGAAMAAAAVAWGVKLWLVLGTRGVELGPAGGSGGGPAATPAGGVLVGGLCVLAAFGVVYLGMTWFLRVKEATELVETAMRRARRKPAVRK